MDDLTIGGAQALAGLLAGLHFAFLVAFMPALHGMDDDTFTLVMVRIIKVIVNPVFLIVFFGAPLLTALLLVWQRTPLTITAVVLGTLALAITFAAHQPLNNTLAAGGTRQAFETPWLVWHALRTLTAVGSFIALLML